ncbi:MAG: hypothetical protein JW751_32450 [Polyangiaceae bacterium]|nr:hypothetical protein [Polyangiaceae bacterium]
MTDLLAALEAAAIRLHSIEASQLSQWANLWLALGRATEAASAGDHERVRRWLKAADAQERDLTSTGILGLVLESLESTDWSEKTPVAQPHSTRYSSQPPPSSGESSHVLRRRLP